MPATWKWLLEYDGTKYHGWQEQPNARTVQAELRKAAQDFFGLAVEIQGAGRTDSGVHALGQVAHCKPRDRAKSSRFNSPPALVLREINDRLPADICLIRVEPAPAAFHARHDAKSRGYLYQISTRRTAFYKRQVWWVKEALDVNAMSRAAKLFEGRHDFTAFAQLDPTKPGESTVVVVERAEIAVEEYLIQFRIEASHFLWKMVRRMTGVLVKVGQGQVTEEDVRRLLLGKRIAGLDVAAWTAPASGLALEKIRY
jgi:tRNA pseudouridine38-40 synthase